MTLPKQKSLLLLTMAAGCRVVIVVLLWLPASCSKLFLCMPCVCLCVSMRVPVDFIAISVLVLIDPLTILRCGCPRVTDECSVCFFPIPLPEGESKGDPQKGWRKKDQTFLFFYPHLPQITAKFLTKLLHRQAKLQTAVMIFLWSSTNG